MPVPQAATGKSCARSPLSYVFLLVVLAVISVYTTYSKLLAEGFHLGIGGGADPGRLFELLDVDGSGRLSPAELLPALPALSAQLGHLGALEGEARGGAELNGTGEVRPKVFFLFLVRVGWSHPDIWERFFRDADEDDHRILMHCQDNETCPKAVANYKAKITIVPWHPAAWCDIGLVAIMNELFRSALKLGPGHSTDKFVLLSEAHVPIKPFAYIKRHLNADSGSDFCFYPHPQQWMAWPGGPPSRSRWALKHHQWIVLSRSHALRAVELDGQGAELMKDLKINSFEFKTSFGCIDEVWHFQVLVGGINLTGTETEVLVPGVNGGLLRKFSPQPQGRCTTFVFWDRYEDGPGGSVRCLGQLLKTDTGLKEESSWNHPNIYKRLTVRSIGYLRNSQYLFMRKLHIDADLWANDVKTYHNLSYAFDRLIFRVQS